jgi:hypothetical protein
MVFYLISCYGTGLGLNAWFSRTSLITLYNNGLRGFLSIGLYEAGNLLSFLTPIHHFLTTHLFEIA